MSNAWEKVTEYLTFLENGKRDLFQIACFLYTPGLSRKITPRKT